MAHDQAEFYASENGDRWSYARAEGTNPACVVHRANPASGGAVTHTDLDVFLRASASGSPERRALADLLSAEALSSESRTPRRSSAIEAAVREWDAERPPSMAGSLDDTAVARLTDLIEEKLAAAAIVVR